MFIILNSIKIVVTELHWHVERKINGNGHKKNIDVEII